MLVTPQKTIPVTIANVESKSEEIMGKIGILNLYKINIQILNFMFQVKNNTMPSALLEKFPLTQDNYPTNFSKNNFKEPKLNLSITKFAISSWGPRLWNKLTTKETKALIYGKLFKNIRKGLLFTLKYGKRNWSFQKTSNQPLTVLRKLIQRRMQDLLCDILDEPASDVS